jgi:hypothetical protein
MEQSQLQDVVQSPGTSFFNIPSDSAHPDPDTFYQEHNERPLAGRLGYPNIQSAYR